MMVLLLLKYNFSQMEEKKNCHFIYLIAYVSKCTDIEHKT